MAQFKRDTTTDLINNGKYSNDATGTIVRTLGFTTPGDGGQGEWKKTGNTVTASQTPALLGAPKCSDALGNEFELIAPKILEAVGGDYIAALGEGFSYLNGFSSSFTGSVNYAIEGEPSVTWTNAYNAGSVTRTTNFFSNSGLSEQHRKYGRVFLGEAAANFSGDSGVTDGGTSWLSDTTNTPAYLAVNSHLVVTNEEGNYAGCFGAKNSTTAGVAAIGVGSVVINDQSTGRGWCFIAEIQHESGANVTNGLEVAAKNKGTDYTYKPYAASFGVFGARMAGGGDDAFGGASTNPSTAAMIVINGTNTWNNGIVFGSDALTGNDGSAGNTTNVAAVVMGRRQTLQWDAPDNTLGAFVTSTVTAGANGTSQQFINDGVNFLNSSGNQGFRMNISQSAQNYLVATTGAANGVLSVDGPSTNADLRLQPKGTGVVQYGTHTAIGAETVTGYITIKDLTGTSRKVAIVS
jgi:hypothetical protein